MCLSISHSMQAKTTRRGIAMLSQNKSNPNEATDAPNHCCQELCAEPRPIRSMTLNHLKIHVFSTCGVFLSIKSFVGKHQICGAITFFEQLTIVTKLSTERTNRTQRKYIPSPLISNIAKASLRSATCSSVNPAAASSMICLCDFLRSSWLRLWIQKWRSSGRMMMMARCY